MKSVLGLAAVLAGSFFLTTNFVFAQTAQTSVSVTCKPVFVSTVLKTLTQDIKAKVAAMKTTSTDGKVTTTYTATPRLKVIYSSKSASQKLTTASLLPNASLAAPAPGATDNSLSITLSGSGAITNKCAPVTATIKMAGSITRTVVTKTDIRRTSERSTLALTGPDFEVTGVPQAF